MKKLLCNTAMEKSPELLQPVKTREQGIEYCAQNATFLFKKGGDVNNKCISFHFFKMENKKVRKMATDRLRGKKKHDEGRQKVPLIHLGIWL